MKKDYEQIKIFLTLIYYALKFFDENIEITKRADGIYNSHALEKRERQLKEGGKPFVDAESWKEFIDDIRQKTLKSSRKTLSWRSSIKSTWKNHNLR